MEGSQGDSTREHAARRTHAGRAGASPTALLRWLTVNFEEWICAILLTILVVAISAAVLFRYVFNAPLPWPEELSRYVFVWLTFMGASLATKRQGHIVVDFLGPFLPRRSRLWIVLTMHSVVMCFLVAFVIYGAQTVERMWVATSPALSIRLGYVYLAIPLGSALMIIHMVRQIPATVRALRGEGGG
jgi:TRAP-type C4-dicarboxylate transport system permease small subunit